MLLFDEALENDTVINTLWLVGHRLGVESAVVKDEVDWEEQLGHRKSWESEAPLPQ